MPGTALETDFSLPNVQEMHNVDRDIENIVKYNSVKLILSLLLIYLLFWDIQ